MPNRRRRRRWISAPRRHRRLASHRSRPAPYSGNNQPLLNRYLPQRLEPHPAPLLRAVSSVNHQPELEAAFRWIRPDSEDCPLLRLEVKLLLLVLHRVVNSCLSISTFWHWARYRSPATIHSSGKCWSRLVLHYSFKTNNFVLRLLELGLTPSKFKIDLVTINLSKVFTWIISKCKPK